MVFNIVAASLLLASCATGQLLYSGGHDFLPYAPYPRLPIPIDTKTQYHYQDEFGNGRHGHDEPLSSHHATHDAYGNKAGEFSYVKADGTIHKTRYIADSLGYRVLSNDLPIGPNDLPAATAHSLRKRSTGYPHITSSGFLADTPEVAAAKNAHFQEHAKLGNFYVANLIPQAHPVVLPNGYLQDTPEVAEAKSAHFAAKAKAISFPQYPQGWTNYYTASPFINQATTTQEGQLIGAPETISAKTSHFAQYEAALAQNIGHATPVSQNFAFTSHSAVPETSESWNDGAYSPKMKRSIPCGHLPAPAPYSFLHTLPISSIPYFNHYARSSLIPLPLPFFHH